MHPRLLPDPGIDRYPPVRAASSLPKQDTREHTLEELLATNQELELFVRTLSHDLRSPIHGVNGWARALEEDCEAELSEVGRQHLKQLREQTRHLASIVDGLYQLLQIGKSAIHPEPLDLSAMAHEIWRRLRSSDPERDAELIIADRMDLLADVVLTRVIVTQLLDNAWKFTRNRAVSRIEVGQRMDGDVSQVFVKDNGAGYAAGRAQKLFLPFQRLHRQNDFPGLGLGLAMAAKAARRQGGDLWAESVEGEGATFFLRL